MDVKRYLSNQNELERMSQGFPIRSNGVLKGDIGVMDKWLVKIVTPNSIKIKLNK